MSTDRDVTRTVRSWLEEGVTTLPDHVLDDVLDQLPATQQRRATRWPARRLPAMSNTAKLALMAAAVVVAALLGIRFLLPDQNVGPPPTPTQSPIALPDTTDVEPGTTYFMGGAWGPATPRLIFTVPADGWSTIGTYNLGKDAIEDPNDFRDIAMTRGPSRTSRPTHVAGVPRASSIRPSGRRWRISRPRCKTRAAKAPPPRPT